MIHFPVTRRAVTGVDLDHPLILQQFENVHQYSPANDPELALLELGILLLETINMQTFKIWFQNSGNDTSAYHFDDRASRERLSLQWFKSIKELLLPTYRQIIGICLRPGSFELYKTDWEDLDFRTAYYREIVEPLVNLLDAKTRV